MHLPLHGRTSLQPLNQHLAMGYDAADDQPEGYGGWIVYHESAGSSDQSFEGQWSASMVFDIADVDDLDCGRDDDTDVMCIDD